MKMTIKNALLIPLCLLLGLATAQADILVVASASSPVSSLTESQVKQLFTGVLHEVAGEKLTPVDLPETSTARDDFYKAIAGRTAQQMRAYWTRLIFTGRGTPPATASESELPIRLKANPELVSYLPDTANTDGLVVLARIR